MYTLSVIFLFSYIYVCGLTRNLNLKIMLEESEDIGNYQ